MKAALFLAAVSPLVSGIRIDPAWNGAHYPTPAPQADRREVEDRGLRIPIANLEDRQHHPDLAVRQAWLRSQGKNLRRKYAHLLDDRGKERVKREIEEDKLAIQRKRDFAERKGRDKRANAVINMIDVGIDASYASQVSIGTPAQQFYVVLDTGSSDLWVAGEECQSNSCLGTTLFNEGSSSTYVSQSTAFNITYGSGEAEGHVARDTVSLGGMSVTSQAFAVVQQTTANLISRPLSGIMGLAWQAVGEIGTLPWWQSLMQSGQLDQTVMGFYMRRWRGTKGVAQVEFDGGEFAFGTLDTSKYTGNINYISMTGSSQDYWRIPAQGLMIQNQSVTLSSPQVAVDTGTTLIGVPSSTAAAIYAQISGSQQLTGQYAGYYEYPCSTVVSSSIQFGGLSYSISNADFNIGSFTTDSTMCTGAFFAFDLSQNSVIQWIAGASFLKNVYSVFRYNPPSVGFAQLSGSASSVSNGTQSTTQTTGSGTGGTGGTGGTTGGGSTSTGGASSLGFSAWGVMTLAAVGGFAGLL